MNGRELAKLIDQRWTVLQHLLDISQRQIAAINGLRMTELMRILSEKQPPLNQLTELADQLRLAAAEDPQDRLWDNSEQRALCRQRQEECERMHLELLAIEAECESSLLNGRERLQEELRRVDAARRTVTSYGMSQSESHAGAQLDLSSDA
jgi:hypothetical protein